MTVLNKQALVAKIRKQTESFDTVVLKEDEANALMDELEAAEKRIAEHNFENRLLANADRDIKALRQRIAELEESLRDKQALLEAAEERYEDMLRQARSFREAHDSASELIRKLERNKPVVKLPTTKLWAGKVACYEESEIIALLTAAGIGVKGE